MGTSNDAEMLVRDRVDGATGRERRSADKAEQERLVEIRMNNEKCRLVSVTLRVGTQ